MSAVTGGCLVIGKNVFEQIEGFDGRFVFVFNDVDLFMKLRENGYLVKFTPYAELYHYESKTRGYDKTLAKQKSFLIF